MEKGQAQNVAKKTGVEEYVLLFGGSDGAPHGDKWSIYVTWTPTRLVETTNVLYDNFRKA